ncbi:RNA polymerase sigma factor [Paenibacillus thermoaerophilus]|uniref:RNA polymerase sigma factor n=1 Tax=Paenibacillus thermoaerophilus TaxID=1215385 RepID=A0ABW2V3V4_9BACL|nr:sigma-70 family RNA polymerase sigma factor [Paenibacillus thermoaerophilus]TMV14403.1 sigma-70 family RNA polymerase sigma factor [Paenibacillus thermoaerophilus]
MEEKRGRKNIFGEAQGCGGECASIHSGREGASIASNDQAWIEAVRNGDAEAYRPFVQAYGDYIYKTVYGVLRSVPDAEDVTQDVLLQVYRSLPDCRMEGLKTWLARIAVNKAIDYKRRRARRPEELTDLPDRLEAGAADAVERTDETVVREERRKLVRERVAELPGHYREVVAAYYMEEKSYEEIAKDTGLERKSVESRLYRARNWMKRHWRKEDFE